MKIKPITSPTLLTAAVALSLGLAGCATHGYLTVTQAALGKNVDVSPSTITIFEGTSMPEKPFDVLGQVTISLVPAFGEGPVDFEKDKHLHQACVEKMKEEATAVGANALAGMYVYESEFYDQPVGGKRPAFITSLLVKILDKGQIAARPQGSFVVGVIPFDLRTTNPTIQTFARKWSFRNAQIQLAAKGYYTLPDPQDLQGKQFPALPEAAPNDVLTLGGEHADLILSLQRASRNRSLAILPGVLGTEEKDIMEAALFSKAARKITWSDSAQGAGATGFLFSSFLPRLKESIALKSAVTQALRGLPSVATITQDVKYDGNRISSK